MVSTNIASKITHEKWYWYRLKEQMMRQFRSPYPLSSPLAPPSIVTPQSDISTLIPTPNSITVPIAHKKDFAELFPDMQARHGEMALCLWDFLDSASAVLGDLSFSLHEIIKCLQPPRVLAVAVAVPGQTICLPTTGQVNNRILIVSINNVYI